MSAPVIDVPVLTPEHTNPAVDRAFEQLMQANNMDSIPGVDFSGMNESLEHHHHHVCDAGCEHNQHEADVLANDLFSDAKEVHHAYHEHNHHDSHKDHEHKHGHEHHGHVCDASCDHGHEEANALAATLFSNAGQEKHDHAHGHHHEKEHNHEHHGHVCDASCDHGHEQADKLAGDMFAKAAEAQHAHEHSHSHSHSHEREHNHEHHGHVCDASCDHGREQANLIAAEAFNRSAEQESVDTAAIAKAVEQVNTEVIEQQADTAVLIERQREQFKQQVERGDRADVARTDRSTQAESEVPSVAERASATVAAVKKAAASPGKSKTTLVSAGSKQIAVNRSPGRVARVAQKARAVAAATLLRGRSESEPVAAPEAESPVASSESSFAEQSASRAESLYDFPLPAEYGAVTAGELHTEPASAVEVLNHEFGIEQGAAQPQAEVIDFSLPPLEGVSAHVQAFEAVLSDQSAAESAESSQERPLTPEESQAAVEQWAERFVAEDVVEALLGFDFASPRSEKEPREDGVETMGELAPDVTVSISAVQPGSVEAGSVELAQPVVTAESFIAEHREQPSEQIVSQLVERITQQQLDTISAEQHEQIVAVFAKIESLSAEGYDGGELAAILAKEIIEMLEKSGFEDPELLLKHYMRVHGRSFMVQLIRALKEIEQKTYIEQHALLKDDDHVAKLTNTISTPARFGKLLLRMLQRTQASIRSTRPASQAV